MNYFKWKMFSLQWVRTQHLPVFQALSECSTCINSLHPHNNPMTRYCSHHPQFTDEEAEARRG